MTTAPRATTDTELADLLKSVQLRATKGRIQLLRILSKESKPLPVTEIAALLTGVMDQVTVYRSLDALVQSRIVHRVGLLHGQTHYELLFGRPHHHHAVCTDCGRIEDIHVPHTKNPEAVALAATKHFTHIDSYSFEFFGRCKACA